MPAAMHSQATSFIQRIAVCGAGTMGTGIAQAAAQAGFATVLYDVQEDTLRKAQAAIAQSLQFLVKKEKLTTEAAAAALDRLSFTTRLEDCAAQVAIEAIVERTDAKLALYRQLEALCGPAALLASNTSSLSITALQEQLARPHQFAGMHFFNPAHIMKLVEIVKGRHTADTTADTLYALAQQLGKTPVHCADAPGFIVNHVARTYYLEAMHLVQSGAATIAQVDAAMEAAGFKMGPFRLMDMIGLDINYTASKEVWEALGKPPRLEPSAWQAAKVQAGELGRKTGKGFYTYENA